MKSVLNITQLFLSLTFLIASCNEKRINENDPKVWAKEYCDCMEKNKLKMNSREASVLCNAEVSLKYEQLRFFASKVFNPYYRNILSRDSIVKIIDNAIKFRDLSDSICKDCQYNLHNDNERLDSFYCLDTAYWEQIYNRFNFDSLGMAFCDCMKKNNYVSDFYDAQIKCRYRLIIDHPDYRILYAAYMGKTSRQPKLNKIVLSLLDSLVASYKVHCIECSLIEDSLDCSQFGVKSMDSSHLP